MEHPKLVQAYDFLESAGILTSGSIINWVARLNQLYSRGWLYGSYHGDKLLAIAGAYRIPSCEEHYMEELPAVETGDNLYIAFFAADSNHPMEPLKLLRQFLTAHPEARRIVYRRKSWNPAHGRSRIKVRNLPADHRLCKYGEPLSYVNRIGIAPPELVPLAAAV